MTVMRKWSLLTAVLVVAVLAAGWFLLVSPKRGDAAALRDQTVSKQNENAGLQSQIAALKEQAKDLPKLQAQLAVIRTQLPSDPQLPKLVRDLSALAKSSGVTLASLAPSDPVALNVTATAPAAPSTTTSKTGTTVTTTRTATTSAALFQVPLQLKVTGTYYELEQFLFGVESLRRPFLSTEVDITAAQTSGTSTSGGSTTTTPGELTMMLTGRVFVAPPATTTSAPAVAAPTSK